MAESIPHIMRPTCRTTGCGQVAEHELQGQPLCDDCHGFVTGTPVNIGREYVLPAARRARRLVHVALMGWSA